MVFPCKEFGRAIGGGADIVICAGIDVLALMYYKLSLLARCGSITGTSETTKDVNTLYKIEVMGGRRYFSSHRFGRWVGTDRIITG